MTDKKKQGGPEAAPGVGNSGFDHQTAADFLSGKTVSDEAVRKFVQASRWAHDEKAALSAMLLSVRGVLASREAEIALLKKALLEAEAAPQQEAQKPVAWFEYNADLNAWFLAYHRNPKAKTRPLVFGDTTPQPAPAPLSRDQIRDVFMAHGFTIKEGQTDLKQYVYDAAYALLRAARAPADSVTAPAGGANWQDISTAPKDGTRFVATGHNYGLYSEGRHICVAQWFRGCWMETSDWNEASELQHLTHWLPLPSPPDDVAAPAEQQAAPKAAPAAVGHDEDLLEKLYWEFDSQRKKTGEDRLAFKVKMRFYASEFLRRSDGKMTFAQSVSDDMMNLADRLGSEYDDVDPIAWKHLLVYAPKGSPAAVAGPSDSEIDALVASIGPTEGMSRDSRDLIMDKLRVLVRRALATWGHVNAAPGEQNESAYQRGYMDGMAKGRRDAEAAPQQEAQGPSKAYAWVYVNKYGVDSIPASKDWCATMVSGHGGSMFPLYAAPQPAPVVGRMSPSKEWLETRLAIADDSDVQAGVPSKNARPCDAPPGCDSHNCHGCDDFKHPSPTPQPAPAPLSDDVVRGAAFEAVRKKLCALPRFSFFSDVYGAIRRVPDKSGSWIAFDDAHALFDPVAVDAALAAQGGKE